MNKRDIEEGISVSSHVNVLQHDFFYIKNDFVAGFVFSNPTSSSTINQLGC